jgi:hypothetical protein
MRYYLQRKTAALETLDSQQETAPDRESLKTTLLKILVPGETVPAALRRLGGGKQARHKGGGGGKQAKPAPVSAAAAAANRELFSQLTDVADGLIVLGFSTIYDMPYDSIDGLLSEWEYRGLDGSVYGPYQGDQIAKWMKAGFFGGDGGAVEMRRVVGGAGSSVGSNGSEQPASKRIRFEESKGENTTTTTTTTPATTATITTTTAAEDLMNDLDDDSDSDPEATAMMRGGAPAAVKRGSVTASRSTSSTTNSTNNSTAPVAASYGAWVLSTSIDFGDLDQSEEEEDIGEDVGAQDEDI